MGEDKKKKSPVQLGGQNPLHPEKKVLTRREYLALNANVFATSVVLPSVYDMLANVAYADSDQCNEAGAAFPGMVPFIVFDCAGGAALPGNWVPFDNGGQPLSSYSRLGLSGNAGNFVMDTRFGAPMAAPIIDPLTLQPINEFHSRTFGALTDPANVNQALLQNLRMATFCVESLSDSQINLFNPNHILGTLGGVGNIMRGPLGMRNTQSSGNSDSVITPGSSKALGISTIDSLTSALSYGTAFSTSRRSAVDALAKALVGLSGEQEKRLMSMNLGAQISALSKCGLIKNQDYTGGVTGIDARADARVNGIWNIVGAQPGNRDAVVATIVMNALLKNSGPATITIAGCDYHDGTQTTGDTRDTQLGRDIARTIATAAALNTPFVFAVITDGGISSGEDNRQWMGDSNGHGFAVIGFWSPTQAIQLTRTQINGYTAGQVANRDHFMGTSPEKVAWAIAANYLAACGQAQRIGQLASANPITVSQMSDIYVVPNGGWL